MNYDYIIIDGHGTLYNDQYHPCDGAIEFLKRYGSKTILFSNIGSKTGDELQKTIANYFQIFPARIHTSLDLLLDHLAISGYNKVFHFGDSTTCQKIKDLVGQVVTDELFAEKLEALVFTSLPRENWIRRMQASLNYIASSNAEILLGNPDRISQITPHKITVAILLEGLINSLSILNVRKKITEFGKPRLVKSFFDIAPADRVVVIGDNPWTDVLLAEHLNCDSILVTSNDMLEEAPRPTLHVKSLGELCG